MLNRGLYQAFSASAMTFFTSLSTEDGDYVEPGMRQLFIRHGRSRTRFLRLGSCSLDTRCSALG